jgi:hypothetical protein
VIRSGVGAACPFTRLPFLMELFLVLLDFLGVPGVVLDEAVPLIGL